MGGVALGTTPDEKSCVRDVTCCAFAPNELTSKAARNPRLIDADIDWSAMALSDIGFRNLVKKAFIEFSGTDSANNGGFTDADERREEKAENLIVKRFSKCVKTALDAIYKDIESVLL